MRSGSDAALTNPCRAPASSEPTVNHRPAAKTHTADQNINVPFHPHAADIRGTSQIDNTPPTLPMKLRTLAAVPEFSPPIAVAVVKNGASAPLMHPDERLSAMTASTALGSRAPAIVRAAADRRHATA